MLRRKVQVLRECNAHLSPGDVARGPTYTSALPPEVLDELLDLAEAINTYFGNPKPGTRRGEKNVKFNTVMERLEWFDFGVYAPDEIRGDDLDRRPYP